MSKDFWGPKKHFQKGGFDYLHFGQGKPILFIHGFGVSPYPFKPVLKVLAKNFAIIAPYLSAGWKDTNLKNERDFDILVAYLAKLLAELKIKNPIIMGYSMGGFVAAKFAVKYQKKIAGLVIIDGLAFPTERKMWEMALAIFSGSTKNIAKISGFKTLFYFYTDFLLNALRYPAILFKQATICLNVNLAIKLKNLNIKTLILWGKKDKVLPLSVGRKLHKIIKTSQLKIVPGDHNWINLHPKIFLTKIMEFADTLK